MSDKVSMSLDEIIKLNKAKKSEATGSKPGNIRGKFPKKGALAGKGRLRGNAAAKKLAGRRSLGGGPRPQGNRNPPGALNAQVVKKLINNAVRRAVARSRPAVGLASRLSSGGLQAKPPRNIITTSSRLAAISNQSRVIQKTRMVPQTRIIRTGRPRLAAPIYEEEVDEEVIEEAPVRLIHRPIQAPRQQIVEVIRTAPRRNPGFRGQNRQLMQQVPYGRLQGGGRVNRAARIAQQQQLTRVIAAQPNRQMVQRIVRPQQRTVVYEDEQPMQFIRKVPRQRIQVMRRAQQQSVQNLQQPRIQRVQQVVEYVEAGPTRVQKNNQFRQALGLGGGRRVVRQVDRFEPSSSFLQRNTVQRGRGFRGY